MPHSVDLSQIRFRHLAAQFFLKAYQQLNALHGIQSEVEFETCIRHNRRDVSLASLANDGQHAFHIRLLQPFDIRRRNVLRRGFCLASVTARFPPRPLFFYALFYLKSLNFFRGSAR